MSKRRRRNSRRRKSSCSMKQTISSYSFQKNIKSSSDYVVKEDHTTEKGESDSFCKEIFLSDDEEKETDISSREKAFGKESGGCKKERANITVQVDEDRKLRITHSVTLSDFGRSPPNIVFQSLDELTARETASIVIEITASGVKYMSSDVRLEVSEIQSVNSDVKTSLVLQNGKEKESQKPQTSSREGFTHPYSWNHYSRKYKQNDKLCENVAFKAMTELKTNEDSSRNPSSLSSQEEIDCCKSCCKDHFCRPHSGGHTDTDFTLVDGSSTCSSPYGFWLPRRWLSQADSHSSETVSDISPLPRFTDKESDALQDLTEDIVSCHIDDSNVFKELEGPQLEPEALESKSQFSIAKAGKTACTQPYELDVHKHVLRSSASVNHNHKENMQMHNNSSDWQSSGYTDILRKRRTTYPGVRYHSGHNGKSKTSYRESFSSGTLSSFFMQSLLCQAERAARYHLKDGKEGITERKRNNSISSTSSQTNSYSFCGDHNIVPNIKSYGSTETPFYPSDSDRTSDVFPNCRHEQVEPAEDPDQISVYKADKESSSIDPLEQSEVAESGFDEEMMEVESPEALTDDNVHQKNLLIHVTPPSVCSSEEQITDAFNRGAKTQTRERQETVSSQKKHSSIVTVIGGYEQRSLHNNSVSEHIVQNHQSETELTSASLKVLPEVRKQHVDVEEPKQLSYTAGRRPSSQSAKACSQTEKCLKKTASTKFKEHLKLGDSIPKESEETSDRWAKKRKLFKESRQWGSAEESSTSNITDESDTVNSEDTRSVDMSIQNIEERGFYTETFHSASWIYRGDDANPNETMKCLSNRPRPVAVRERTVKISKGMGEYPWGFRIQYSKPIIVTEVDTNGAAEEAGLKVGDYVLAVNGTDVTGVPHSEAVDLARQGPDLLNLTIGSDIGRTPNTPKPGCRGYLHKRTQSSFLKGWRKRWFVLRHDCCLYYYRNKRDEGKSQALAAMRMEGAVVEADTSLGKPFVFKCSPVAGTRVYYFCATSNQEMRSNSINCKGGDVLLQNHVWVDVTRHNSNLPPLAVKHPECLGLLNLLDKNKDSWVQHYCILKDGCLYFYASIRSTYAVGGIYLHGYTVREQHLGFKRSTIELKPPSEEFKVFYLCAENVNENKRWIGAIKTSIGKWLPWHQALQDYMSRPPEETKM
ncbi:hypothetical protein Q7C36_020190 [Tachysurus vachellii]|uniref:PDZ and pleckstrin homology domains 1 n=1 Tax=Tachysurus vachellii TaxID=175792 RepID=A0AA88RXA8_TACVA|nr:hypothetical protein Q7C36_020190 [Tachysurus vachellii]